MLQVQPPVQVRDLVLPCRLLQLRDRLVGLGDLMLPLEQPVKAAERRDDPADENRHSGAEEHRERGAVVARRPPLQQAEFRVQRRAQQDRRSRPCNRDPRKPEPRVGEVQQARVRDQPQHADRQDDRRQHLRHEPAPTRRIPQRQRQPCGQQRRGSIGRHPSRMRIAIGEPRMQHRLIEAEVESQRRLHQHDGRYQHDERRAASTQRQDGALRMPKQQREAAQGEA
ncbi:MAG TPA: hypothetical protein VM491_06040, partial [Burkholderiaceae bacterium]|nr:hypothetical protein [Burkholderiaceae bacterium]